MVEVRLSSARQLELSFEKRRHSFSRAAKTAKDPETERPACATGV
jgi:hypothetical protein